jgi:tetratricopeptide (TPR) repeat protein
MGRVRVACDRKLDRIVAVKELLHDTPAARARFDREVKIAARLQHPAIIPIYDATMGGRSPPSYSMRLVAGQSLAELIRRADCLEDRLALLPNVIAVADAIAYAHSQSIIHRDLKPLNVLIGDFGDTVVIDWGIAKDLTWPDDALDACHGDRAADPMDVTATGAVLGTPGYMSPEQARGGPVDERADVYALGAMLRDVLTPRPGDEDLTAPARDRPPARPAPRVMRGAPAELVAIVNKAMATAPAARYPTARELAADLHRFHTGQLVSAHRYGAVMLARRFVRKHRAAVVASAVLLVALSIGGAISVRRIQAERDVADTRLVAAEDLVQFVITDLRDRLEPLGKLELLASVGERVDRYYRAIDAQDQLGGEPGRRALTHRIYSRQLVGDVELAKGNSDGALAAHADRLQLARRLGRQDLITSSESSIGDLLAHRGDTEGALAAYRRARAHAASSGDAWWRSRVEFQIGIMLRDKGDLAGALAAYQAALELGARAITEQPDALDRRLGVAQAQARLAEILDLRGDAAGALVQLRQGRDALLAVAAGHPDHAAVMRALSIFHSHIAELLREQGDLGGALEAFRQSQAIGLALAAREPLNQNWKRDVAVDHETISNVLQAQGDRVNATAELTAARAVFEQVAAADPSAVQPQEDLAIVMADEATLCADPGCAARALRRAVELDRALEARDPIHTEYPRRRIRSQLRLAAQLHALHDPTALAIARAGLADALVSAHTAPAEVEWPALIARGKVTIAQITAGTPGGAAESRQLAGEALAWLRAAPRNVLNVEFDAMVADELALAEALASGQRPTGRR